MEPTKQTFTADEIAAEEVRHGDLIYHDTILYMRVQAPAGSDYTHWVDITDGEQVELRRDVQVSPVTIKKFEVEVHASDHY